MFEGLQEDQMQAAIEALLFVSDEPVSVSTLSHALEASKDDVQRALWEIQERYEDEQSGIQLLEVGGAWRLYTHPAFHELIEAYVGSWDTRRLSSAALEVLAIVAYLQPITRMQLSSIRGVTSDGPLNTLIERGYVRESGILDAPGNPSLFSTTQTFLEKYGLASIDDLPPLEEFAPDESSARLIRERLGGARFQSIDQQEGNIEYPVDGQIEHAHEAEALTGAFAEQFGLVEKVDLSKLTFNTDDE